MEISTMAQPQARMTAGVRQFEGALESVAITPSLNQSRADSGHGSSLRLTQNHHERINKLLPFVLSLSKNESATR